MAVFLGAIPLLTIAKLLALGSIKIVFLLIGAGFFPVFTLRMILGGASGMILPVLDHLHQDTHITNELRDHTVEQLEMLEKLEFERSEARKVLLVIIKNSLLGLVTAIKSIPQRLSMLLKHLSSRLKG